MNGTIGNTVQDERGSLPYPVIIAAIKGDSDSMAIVIKRYESYIADLSMRNLCDDEYRIFTYPDPPDRMPIKQQLEMFGKMASSQLAADRPIPPVKTDNLGPNPRLSVSI